MIRIHQIKLDPKHSKEDIFNKSAKILKIPRSEILNVNIVKQSIDARKKPDIFYVYTVDVCVSNEKKCKLQSEIKQGKVSIIEKKEYSFPNLGAKKLAHRPVIIGTGPAGLFCGYFLAKNGYRPILLERGKCVEERKKDVSLFWEQGILNEESNVQFGEGGAGTFSDGKLNTLVKDKDGRNYEVLKVFVLNGAKESILYENKPHIGTDVLCNVVKNMRTQIEQWGGEVHFESKVTDIRISTINGKRKISAVCINNQDWLETENVVLAIGHSARDTFSMLLNKEVPMQCKSFAVGFRVEHKQSMINENQYGNANLSLLPVADYKLTAKTKNGRGVYSFCMCPGGYVVNASSEHNRLAVNGMSYSGRDGINANSAIIVSVTPDDFDSEHPLAGVSFQQKLEEKAYLLANGKIPVQRFGDFKAYVKGSFDIIKKEQEENCSKNDLLLPQIKGQWAFADLSKLLPKALNESFVEGMECFGNTIKGFSNDDTILSGVESRTSSPVRIDRNDMMQSEIEGLYPCGEGAGYAGGITSAAMDGLRIAETIAKGYAPLTVN